MLQPLTALRRAAAGLLAATLAAGMLLACSGAETDTPLATAQPSAGGVSAPTSAAVPAGTPSISDEHTTGEGLPTAPPVPTRPAGERSWDEGGDTDSPGGDGGGGSPGGDSGSKASASTAADSTAPPPTTTPTATPVTAPTPTPAPAPTTPNPTAAPQPTTPPNPTTAPNPTAAPQPTPAPQPTATPNPTATPEPTATPQPTARPTATPAPAGDAPLFALPDSGGNIVSLESYIGRQNVVLVFYRGFW